MHNLDTIVAHFSNIDNWTQITHSVPGVIRGLVQGADGNITVSTGTNNGGYSSDDGLTWSGITYPFGGSHEIRDFTVNGNQRIGVGEGNTALTSVDGINWVDMDPQTSSWAYSGSAHHDGRWVATGYVGAVYASNTQGNDRLAYTTDLFDNDPARATWTTVSLPTAYPFYGVAYGAGKWVVLSHRSTQVVQSIDGVNWAVSAHTTPSSSQDLAFANDIFIAASDNSNGIMWSEDGDVWTNANITGPSSAYQHVLHNGVYWLAASNGSSTIAVSVDGKTWTSFANPTGVVFGAHTNLNNEGWVLGSWGGNTMYRVSNVPCEEFADYNLCDLDDAAECVFG